MNRPTWKTGVPVNQQKRWQGPVLSSFPSFFNWNVVIGSNSKCFSNRTRSVKRKEKSISYRPPQSLLLRSPWRGGRGLRSAQSFLWVPTLCDPVDRSPPGSSVHGTLQARILEWVPMPSYGGSSQPRDRTRVSCIAAGFPIVLSHQEAHGH